MDLLLPVADPSAPLEPRLARPATPPDEATSPTEDCTECREAPFHLCGEHARLIVELL